jgi:inhibitor of cysteine peptidase
MTKLMLNLSTRVAAAAMAAMLVVAGPVRADENVVVVGEEQNDGTVEVSRAQNLQLRLPAQFGTGSSWGVTALEGGVLRLSDMQPGETSQPGGIETQVFLLIPIGVGEGTLALDYRRPWERDKPPEKTFKLKVSVRAD